MYGLMIEWQDLRASFEPWRSVVAASSNPGMSQGITGTDPAEWTGDAAAALDTLPVGHAVVVPDLPFFEAVQERPAVPASRLAGAYV